MYPFHLYGNLNVNKIYAKYFLYMLGLIEISNSKNEIFRSNVKSSFFILKKIKKNIQVLRSPNRHKKAQFHIAKKNYILNSSISIKLNKYTSDIVCMEIINLVYLNFFNFESSLICLKNIRINLDRTLKFNFFN